jgi:beta-lactam-binding protein with PASTA domain
MRQGSRLIRLVVLTVVASACVVIGSSALAQTTQARLAFVNGTGAEPVSVTVDGAEVASDLAFAATSDAQIVDNGEYAVAFSDGSSWAGLVPPATAWTVVSGYGPDGGTAQPYPVVIEEIPSGQAIVAVWNATATDADIAVDGATSTVAPGELAATIRIEAGGTVTVESGGVTADVTPGADNYIDVFVVDNGAAVGIAQSIVPSMTALVDAIGLPTVPDVVGLPSADAEAALVAAGYNVGSQEQASDTVVAGVVIETQPPAGIELATGEIVTLVVSTGPSTVEVPDVVGLALGDAQAQLEAVGLTSTATQQPDPDIEEGLVISTNPSAGIAVAPGTSVSIIWSAGPEDVEVPDLLGLTADEAQAVADDLGLSLSVVEDPDDPDPEGFVVEQDPAAGELVPAGSEVTVQLSPATQEPWASIKVDPTRVLTAGGINFEPQSVATVSILATDLTAKEVVDDSGYWRLTIDTSSLDPNVAYDVLITGTAEDGSAYEATFMLPPVGETVDEPQDEGLPTWVWVLLIALLLVALILGVALIVEHRSRKGSGGDGSGTTTTSGSTAGEGAAPPPPAAPATPPSAPPSGGDGGPPADPPPSEGSAPPSGG